MPRRSKAKANARRDDAQQKSGADTIATRFVLCSDPQVQVPWSRAFSAHVDNFITNNRVLLSILVSHSYWAQPLQAHKDENESKEAEESKRKNCMVIEFSCAQNIDAFLVDNDPQVTLRAIHPASNGVCETLAPLLGCSPDVLVKLDHTRSHFSHAFVVAFILKVAVGGAGEEENEVVFVSVLTQDVVECHPLVAHKVNPIVLNKTGQFVIPTLTQSQKEDEAEVAAQAIRSQRIDTLLQNMAEFRMVTI